MLAGLGRQVQSTGLLPVDAIDTAFDALRRFRALCDILHVRRIWAIATAACRDARNGRAFIAEAERICKTKITILSGKREAHLTALGIVSGIYKPDGIVGDLGGGSLELVDVHGSRVRGGVTLPFGGLALQDITGKSLKKAEKYVEEAFEDLDMLHDGEDRTFYILLGFFEGFAGDVLKCQAAERQRHAAPHARAMHIDKLKRATAEVADDAIRPVNSRHDTERGEIGLTFAGEDRDLCSANALGFGDERPAIARVPASGSSNRPNASHVQDIAQGAKPP